MAFTITIRTNATFKTKPDLAALRKMLGGAVHIGGVGPYNIFQQQPAAPQPENEAEYMLYGAASPLGRGFYLAIRKGFAEYVFTSHLPTTRHDLEDMFTAAGLLAKGLNAKTIEVDGEEYPRAALNALFPDVVVKNRKMLKSYAATYPGFDVSAIIMPLQLPTGLCQRIVSVPEANGEVYLSDYLHEKQCQDFYYMKPSFRRNTRTGEIVGTYALTEGVDSVVQKQPFIPYGAPPSAPREVDRWLVGLVGQNLGPMGFVPYNAFLQYLEGAPKNDFDDRHYFIYGLSEKRMRELLAKDRTDF